MGQGQVENGGVMEDEEDWQSEGGDDQDEDDDDGEYGMDIEDDDEDDDDYDDEDSDDQDQMYGEGQANENKKIDLKSMNIKALKGPMNTIISNLTQQTPLNQIIKVPPPQKINK